MVLCARGFETPFLSKRVLEFGGGAEIHGSSEIFFFLVNSSDVALGSKLQLFAMAALATTTLPKTARLTFES